MYASEQALEWDFGILRESTELSEGRGGSGERGRLRRESPMHQQLS